MENYYEILEISENASQEVIERVYKLLAKKYHPDLNPDNPKAAEEKFKQISVAYDTLSNESKRKSYDEKLRAYKASKNAQNMSNINYQQNTPNYNSSNASNYSQDDFVRYQQELIRRQQEKLRKQYNDAYVSALGKMGIKVVYKKTLREHISSFLALLLTLGVLLLILIILWFIPYTHKKMVEIYDNSGPVKYIVEMITEKNEKNENVENTENVENLEDSEVK